MKRVFLPLLAILTLCVISPLTRAEDNTLAPPQQGQGGGWPGMMYGPGYNPDYQMGPGMMYGPGYGYGPGYQMGPGMMYGPGYGYGPDYQMGPGMMYGPGYSYGPGYQMGPGMMYGPGYGYGPGGMSGPCYGQQGGEERSATPYPCQPGMMHH